MKFTSFTPMALAVMAAAGFTASSAQALTYNLDDLFLGFRQTGNSSDDFIINLGAAATFRDASTPFTLTLANFDSQLSTLFGATWKTDGTVQWGIVGTPGTSANVGIDTFNLLYVSRPGDSANPLTTTAPLSSSDQSNSSSIIGNMKNYYSLSTTVDGTVANSEKGVPTNSNSWSVRIGASLSAPGRLSPIDGDTSSPFGLDLFRVPEGGANAAITNEGRFTFVAGAGNENQILFTPAVVPEPSSAVLCGLSLISLGFMRKRKAARLQS